MKIKVGILACILGFCALSQAEARCNKLDLAKVSASLSDASASIEKLKKAYLSILKCNAMDGEYSEGFNDEANNLLANNWPGVIKAKEIEDKKFRKALIKSISEGSEKNTFLKICASAAECIKSNSFCTEMNTRCEEINTWVKKKVK